MAMTGDLFLLGSEELAWALSKNTPARKLMASLIGQLEILKIEIDPKLWDWNNIARFCYSIRRLTGCRRATKEDAEVLIALLLVKAKSELFTLEKYRAAAYDFCHDQKIEPFSQKELDRHIRSAMHRFEKQLFKSIQFQLTKPNLKQDLRGVKLKHIKSEALRIEIHEALNVVEMINSTMSFIFYGKLGEISTNNKDDQELGIACLHL